MVREIEVVTFLKNMEQGVSRPVQVIGDDFKEYILKNENIDNNGTIQKYNCMFINELLAYQIGTYLEIPMPEAVIAYVDDEFSSNDPTIMFAYRFKEGKYFATRKLENIENNIVDNYEEMIRMNKPRIKMTWRNFLKNIKNKDDIAKIVAFDILIFNFDRLRNEGNILLNLEANNNRRLYAIDHGHAFGGPTMNDVKVNILRRPSISQEYIDYYSSLISDIIGKDLSGTGIIFKTLEEYINLDDLENHSFKSIVCKIEAISEEMIDKWFESIPNEWFIDRDFQIAHYKNFILKQKQLIRYIIQNMAEKNAFSNYRGGILKWEVKNKKSTTVS